MANLSRKGERESMGWPSDPFRMMREFMRMDPFGEMEAMPSAQGFVPQVEVKETKDGIVITADLPGIREEDVDISVVGRRLSLSGSREASRREENDRYYAYERSYGSFHRAFTLPEGADVENIQANMQNGVLTLRVPLRAEVQPRRITLGGQKGEQRSVDAQQPEAQQPEAQPTQKQKGRAA